MAAERLAALLVGEAVARERHRLWLAQEADRLLRAVLTDLRQQLLVGGDGLTATNRARLLSLYADAAALLRQGLTTTSDTMTAHLRAFAAVESDVANAMAKEITRASGVAILTPTISPATLAAAATTDIQGATLPQWFAKLGNDLAFRTQRTIQIGLIAGETIPQIVTRALATSGLGGPITRAARRDVTAVVRTSATAVAAQAQEATFVAQDSDVTSRYQYVATLDDRTTVICASLDGQTFRYDDPSAPRPPQHLQCRSSIVPVVDWGGLGISPKDVPPVVRASADGPVSWRTYDAWLKGQSDATQSKVLGKGLADLYRTGKTTLADLVSANGKPMTLAAMRIQLGL